MTPNAQNAIEILSKLMQKTSAAHMAYWVGPNVVLTLAGARGYCDGVFWGDPKIVETWKQEIDSGLKVLNSITDAYMCNSSISTSTFGETGASFDLILHEGLAYTLKSTNLLSISQNMIKDVPMQNIMTKLVSCLKEKHGNEYTDEDYGHIAFGILLGYPDDAIIGSTQATEESPLKEANITNANYYKCPQPIYDYPMSISDNKSIKAHEKLWSTILTDFYNSGFHRRLTAIPEFQQKLDELELKPA